MQELIQTVSIAQLLKTLNKEMNGYKFKDQAISLVRSVYNNQENLTMVLRRQYNKLYVVLFGLNLTDNVELEINMSVTGNWTKNYAYSINTFTRYW